MAKCLCRFVNVFSVCVLLLSTGCATKFKTTVLTERADLPSFGLLNHTRSNLTVVLQQIALSRNGAKILTPQTVVDSCLYSLRNCAVVDDVWIEYPIGQSNIVTSINLHCTQEEFLHIAGNTTKAFVIGFSLFLLSPIITYDYELESELLATIFLPNGHQIALTSRCLGECRYNCFYPRALAIEGVRGRVWEEHLRILNDQLQNLPLVSDAGIRHD